MHNVSFMSDVNIHLNWLVVLSSPPLSPQSRTVMGFR